MAKIVEEHILIKVSKLVRGNGDGASVIPQGIEEMLEGVASEIINDPAAIVEVILDPFASNDADPE